MMIKALNWEDVEQRLKKTSIIPDISLEGYHRTAEWKFSFECECDCTGYPSTCKIKNIYCYNNVYECGDVCDCDSDCTECECNYDCYADDDIL